MLEVKGLQVRYGSVEGVRQVELNVAPGEIVALIGPNGAGKSSVLNAIAGLVPCAAGEIMLNGRPITRLQAAARVYHGLSLVVEGRGVFADMSVRENLELGAFSRPEQCRPPALERAIERVVALFPRVGERMNQIAGSLSGGEQQMLVIGRALMAKPSLLLLDEPSLGLAPRIVGEISHALTRLSRDAGLSILVAEQNAVLGLEFAERAYVLNRGRVAISASCKRLREDGQLENAYFN